jgi:hypothetical protein
LSSKIKVEREETGEVISDIFNVEAEHDENLLSLNPGDYNLA